MDDMTEHQAQFYKELGMCCKRHMMENDITPIEVLGIIDLVKTEVRESTFMDDYYYLDTDADEEGEKEF